MLSVSRDYIGEVAIVECEGTISSEEDPPRLRDAIINGKVTRVIVLDLSGIKVLTGWGLEVLGSLQRWAQEHNIQLKLFNPSFFVKEELKRANFVYEFEIDGLHEVMTLLTSEQNGHNIAA